MHPGDVTLHGLTHHSPFNVDLLRKMLSGRVNTEADEIGPLLTNLIGNLIVNKMIFLCICILRVIRINNS